MSEHMTPQDAACILETIREIGDYTVEAKEAVTLGISALRASVPHILTLDEARSLEPHTAIYAEFKNEHMDGPYAIGDIYREGYWHSDDVRWWTAWPDEELRAATTWIDTPVAK